MKVEGGERREQMMIGQGRGQEEESRRRAEQSRYDRSCEEKLWRRSEERGKERQGGEK